MARRSKMPRTSPGRSAPWRRVQRRNCRCGARARRRPSPLRSANCRTSARPRRERPTPPAGAGPTAPSGRGGPDVPRLGLTVAPAGQVAGSGSEGVVVTEVDPNGLASDQGFKTGDVILEVGGKKVANPVEVRPALTEAQNDGRRTILM